MSEADELSAYEYGKSLGIAFQMIDDLLDYVSTSSVTGKPTVNDLKLGNNSLAVSEDVVCYIIPP